MAKREEEMFEIELAKLVRDAEPPFGFASYDVTFECHRTGHTVEATVEVDAEQVTTLEILPRAMSELNGIFTALAAQTGAWRIEGE